MLLLAAIALAPEPPARPPRAAATATVRIERPVEVRSEHWAQLPREMRREVIGIGDDGRPVLLRLVEMP